MNLTDTQVLEIINELLDKEGICDVERCQRLRDGRGGAASLPALLPLVDRYLTITHCQRPYLQAAVSAAEEDSQSPARDWTNAAWLGGALARGAPRTIIEVEELVSSLALSLGVVCNGQWSGSDQRLTPVVATRIQRAGGEIVRITSDAWFWPPEAAVQQRSALFKVCFQLDTIVEALCRGE